MGWPLGADQCHPDRQRSLPDIQHQVVGGNLYCIFKHALKERCRDYRPCPPIDWKLQEDIIIKPDFLIIKSAVSDRDPLTTSPVLVAEILERRTAVLDRKTKFMTYELQKVKYLLIIDAAPRKLEVYELIDDQYQPMAINPKHYEFTFHDNCKIPISFTELWD